MIFEWLGLYFELGLNVENYKKQNIKRKSNTVNQFDI